MNTLNDSGTLPTMKPILTFITAGLLGWSVLAAEPAPVAAPTSVFKAGFAERDITLDIGAEALKTLLLIRQGAARDLPLGTRQKVWQIKRRVPTPEKVKRALDLVQEGAAKAGRWSGLSPRKPSCSIPSSRCGPKWSSLPAVSSPTPESSSPIR